jgi:hypothetical protein
MFYFAINWGALPLIKGCIGIKKAYTGQPIASVPELFPCTDSIFVWHLTGKLYGAFPLIKRDNGGPQQLSCSLRVVIGYTHKCIIETIGWFDILIDYCNIFTLIL